jgi:hypothetical protein
MEKNTDYNPGGQCQPSYHPAVGQTSQPTKPDTGGRGATRLSSPEIGQLVNGFQDGSTCFVIKKSGD